MRKTETTLGDMMEENGGFIGLHAPRSHSDSMRRHDEEPRQRWGMRPREKETTLGNKSGGGTQPAQGEKIEKKFQTTLNMIEENTDHIGR